jgi:mono/diheme cytochrome c family protein
VYSSGVRRLLSWLGPILFGVVAAGGLFVAFEVRAFDQSLAKVYSVSMPPIARSTDPAVLERGKHLAGSVAGCATSDCHGADLGGGKEMDLGPLGVAAGVNLTPSGILATYSDAELGRLVLHGVRQDGRSVRLMPVEEINWLSDADLTAIISYLRTVPPVTRPLASTRLTLVAKVLDRLDLAPIDIARRIDHTRRATAPAPAPTAAYGAFLARGCVGCHGEHLSGGPIPGAPASFAVPRNLTPHGTGLGRWTFADFVRLADTGTRPDGTRVDPTMPIEGLSRMDDTERRALWAYLESLPPRPFGQR